MKHEVKSEKPSLKKIKKELYSFRKLTLSVREGEEKILCKKCGNSCSIYNSNGMCGRCSMRYWGTRPSKSKKFKVASNMDFNINNIIAGIDLSKFKLVKGVELSKEEIVSNLSKGRCPVCKCKLYQTFDGSMWVCRSKRSKDKFVVRDEVMQKYI